MSSTYGAIQNDVAASSAGSSRRRPAAAASTKPTAGIATVSSSVVNLTNTIVGAGALAFPSAFAAMGMLPGILSCLFSASCAMFGLWCLSRCATQVGQRPGDEGRKASFNEVARITFGKGWATRLFDLAIAIKCFGVSVSYLIICKTLLPQVTLSISRAFRHPLQEHSILLSPDFWLVLTMIVIVPLSFLKTLDSLRFTSQIALSTVVYLIIVVVGWFFVKGPSPDRGSIEPWRFRHNTLSSFPVQVFAYTCAQNLFPIFNELKDRNQKKMNAVIFTSIGTAAACYEVLGIIGYLTFGSKVGSNIIAMYPPTSFTIALGRLGIVMLVGLSYPLQCLPCRACLHTLTSGLIRKKRAVSPTDITDTAEETGDTDEVDDDDVSEQDTLVPKGDNHLPRGTDMTRTKFTVLTSGILIAGFLIAAVVDELEVVLGFVGSTGSTIISFILPGFFYFRLFRDEKGPTKWFALALGIYGMAVMAFCLTFNIVKLAQGQPPAGH